MTTIWKYELMPGETSIAMPQGAKVLSVGCQTGGVFLWAEVDPDEKQKKRRFVIYGTGHDIYDTPDESRQFIGTALMHGGSLIWHVFELLG